MPVLDPTFNVIVAEFAPARFMVTDKQYTDFAEMRADYAARGFISVNVDHSDGTIFGAASVNWQFRAWHDMCHLIADAPFTPDGERAAAEVQKAQVRARYGASTDVYRWNAIIDAEVNGQVAYYLQTGGFPTDQYAYVQAYLAERYALVLPVDGNGWRNGFAVARIQERRAAEIAPAVFGDFHAAYKSTSDIPARVQHALQAAEFAERARVTATAADMRRIVENGGSLRSPHTGKWRTA